MTTKDYPIQRASRIYHLHMAAGYIGRAIEELEHTEYTVAQEKLREIHKGLIKLSTYL